MKRMTFFARPPSIARLIESERSPPLHALLLSFIVPPSR
jgi:hypothetical protein